MHVVVGHVTGQMLACNYRGTVLRLKLGFMAQAMKCISIQYKVQMCVIFLVSDNLHCV